MMPSVPSPTQPTFAVVVPVYNGRTHLAETLRSVMAQTYAAHEIIVIEDGSASSSADLMKDFPTVLYRVQANAGVSAARNHGARIAEAAWICFLDQDDVLLPGHLQQFAERLKHDGSADLMYTPRYVLKETAGVWASDEITSPPQGAELRTALLQRCPFPPSGIAVRRSVFLQSGSFNSRYDLAEDWEFWLRCMQQGRTFAACDEATVCYRVHPESNSHRPLPILAANKRVIEECIAPMLVWPQMLWRRRQLISRQEADAAILLRQVGQPGALRLLLRSMVRCPLGEFRRYLIALHMLLSKVVPKAHDGEHRAPAA